MLIAAQHSLWCSCGQHRIACHGRCERCYRSWRRDLRQFGGLRSRVLVRDGKQCLGCGEMQPEQLIVHHRSPGLQCQARLATLCRACHARIHHRGQPSFEFTEFLRTLWREQHRGVAEQDVLRFGVIAAIPADLVSQVSLFEAA